MKPRVKAGKIPANADNTRPAGETAKSIMDSMTKGQIPDPKVDMAKKCTTCGTMGATETGQCLPCASKDGAAKEAGKANGAPAQVDLKGKGGRKAKPEKAVGKKRPEQLESPALVPAMDGVGKAAKRLVEAIRNVEDAIDERGEAETGLLMALRKAKRQAIQVLGYKLQIDHKAAVDKIKVQKPK